MDKVFCHSQDLDGKLKEVISWDITEQNKKDIPEFIRAYELGKITGRRGTNPQGSLLRSLYFLKVSLENLEGETKTDLDSFLEKLLKDKIKAYNPKLKKYSGEPYALRSKREILNILQKYLSWKHPDKSATYKAILGLKLAGKKNELDILTDEQLESLVKEDVPSDKKFLLAILGSGGLRAEEFHNIRYSDFELPKGKDMFVKLTIRNQFSKTKGRTIALYDKWVLPAVKQYLAERIEEGIRPEEIVFKTTYTGNKKWLQRFGKRVIGKPVSYHQFRHTSATRLSSKLNRQQLCVYFGWNFSSHMPDIYIERSGVNMIDVESKFSNTNFEEQQKQIDELKEQTKLSISIMEKITNTIADSIIGMDDEQQEKILSKLKKQFEELPKIK